MERDALAKWGSSETKRSSDLLSCLELVTQEIVDALFVDPFAVMNTIGLIAFAL